METARLTTTRPPLPDHLLEEGLIRAGFLPPLPPRTRIARRLGRTLATARRPARGGEGRRRE